MILHEKWGKRKILKNPPNPFEGETPSHQAYDHSTEQKTVEKPRRNSETSESTAEPWRSKQPWRSYESPSRRRDEAGKSIESDVKETQSKRQNQTKPNLTNPRTNPRTKAIQPNQVRPPCFPFPHGSPQRSLDRWKLEQPSESRSCEKTERRPWGGRRSKHFFGPRFVKWFWNAAF